MCLSMRLFVLRFSKSDRCYQPLSYTLRELSPTYLCFLILAFKSFSFSLSPAASSSAFFSSLSSHNMHHVSYTIFLLVQSCVDSFPVLCLVRPFRRIVKEKTDLKALEYLNNLKAKHSKVMNLDHQNLTMQTNLEPNEISVQECKFMFALRSRMLM